MNPIALISLLNLIFALTTYSQDSEFSDSLSPNWKDLPSAEHSATYHFTTFDLQSFVNGAELQLNENLNFVGFEYSGSTKFCKGPFLGFGVYNMIANTVVINYNKYKLSGTRAGLRFGYKCRFLNRIIFEPAGIVEYGNFRIQDKTADSKLNNNSLNLGLEFSFKAIPYINFSNKFALCIGFFGGYLWKVPNKEWIASRHFDSQISADPLNWSGWNFGFKIGVVEFDLE